MLLGRFYTEYVGFEYGLTEQKRICSVFFVNWCPQMRTPITLQMFQNMLYYKRQNGTGVRSSG